MSKNSFYDEALEILLIYGNTFEKIAMFSEKEKELLQVFEDKKFELEQEREIQQLLLKIRQRYLQYYSKIRMTSKIHEQMVEEILSIKHKMDSFRSGNFEL